MGEIAAHDHERGRIDEAAQDLRHPTGRPEVELTDDDRHEGELLESHLEEGNLDLHAVLSVVGLGNGAEERVPAERGDELEVERDLPEGSRVVRRVRNAGRVLQRDAVSRSQNDDATVSPSLDLTNPVGGRLSGVSVARMGQDEGEHVFGRLGVGIRARPDQELLELGGQLLAIRRVPASGQRGHEDPSRGRRRRHGGRHHLRIRRRRSEGAVGCEPREESDGGHHDSGESRGEDPRSSRHRSSLPPAAGRTRRFPGCLASSAGRNAQPAHRPGRRTSFGSSPTTFPGYRRVRIASVTRGGRTRPATRPIGITTSAKPSRAISRKRRRLTTRFRRYRPRSRDTCPTAPGSGSRDTARAR